MDGTIRDIHNYPLRLSRAIRHLLNNNKVSNKNRLAILRFTAHMGVVERVCMARMTFYVPKLERLAELLGKNFVDATEDDIRSVVGKLNTMKVRFVRKKGEQVLVSDRTISGWTREGYKIALKRFFRWLRKKRKGHDPSETDWIEVKKIKTKIKASDLLSPDEVLLLLRTRRGQHPRNRALILLLFETGARPMEVLNLHIGDVSFDKYGAKVVLCGKNIRGERTPRPEDCPFTHPTDHAGQRTIGLTNRRESIRLQRLETSHLFTHKINSSNPNAPTSSISGDT